MDFVHVCSSSAVIQAKGANIKILFFKSMLLFSLAFQ